MSNVPQGKFFLRCSKLSLRRKRKGCDIAWKFLCFRRQEIPEFDGACTTRYCGVDSFETVQVVATLTGGIWTDVYGLATFKRKVTVRKAYAAATPQPE